MKMNIGPSKRTSTKTNVKDKFPLVSVVIPVRNEEEHLACCLQSAINQDYPQELIEVIVVDGGSDDSSLKIVREIAEEHSNIRLLGGIGVNCPAAMNIGIKNSAGDVIAKVDAHGYVAPDFLRISVKYLSKEEGIKCVGGPIRSVARSLIARTNALARSSIFGVGKGIYSLGEKPRFVDTVQCGVYKKDIFDEVGPFDELLQFGEDEEVNWRIRKKGYKIFATPEMKFFYFPRNSFGRLFRQYYNYGAARVRVIKKHRDFFRIRHVIPTAFVLALLAAGILSIFGDWFSRLFFGMVVAYVLVSLVFSSLISAKEGYRHFGLLPISFAALHFGYGIGFAGGVIRFCVVNRIRQLRSRGIMI